VSFANTVSDRRRAPRDFAELAAWLVRHGALDPADAERLGTVAAEHADEAAAVFAFADRARQLLWRLFNELADHRKLSPALLEEVNAELVDALPRERIVAAKNGFRWERQVGGAGGLERTLRPVILSAAEILTSRYFAQVARCAGEGCDLLFVRRTSGSPRRWCSMKSCGKLVKSRRHYQEKIKPQREELNERHRAEKRKFLKEWGPVLAAARRKR
jgi:predicted RNA-binding Zn ribbon-like protein